MYKVIIVILILFSIHFWGFSQFPPKFNNFTNAISLLVMGISFVRIWQRDGLQFNYAIFLFLVGLFINIISAYINQGQGLLDTFLSMGPVYFFILFYFFLHYLKVDQKFLENIIIVFAVLYSIFYIIQIIAYPLIIFKSPVVALDRGTMRLRIEGNGFLMLAYFLLLNRFILNRRIIYLLLAIVFFIIMLIGGFRTLTLAAFLLSGLMFVKLIKFSFTNYILLALIALAVVGLFHFQPTAKILNSMIVDSIEEKAQGKENIRFKELIFYFNVYPQNSSVFIMGGGLPGSKGSYSRSMEILGTSYDFYWTDLGLIGFYIVVGAIALLGLLWYSIKAVFIKSSPNNIYLNFYFAYLLLVSFTTMEIYRPGIFGVQAIALYLIDLDIACNKTSDDVISDIRLSY
jgi:hypothetical protein